MSSTQSTLTLEDEKKEAIRLNRLMHIQKGLVTREVNKATNLIKEYKTEKAAKSSLTRTTAEAAFKSLEVAEEKVMVLLKTIDRHNELILLVCTPDQVKATEENAAKLDTYIKMVTELRRSEIEMIREMTNEITPVVLPAEGVLAVQLNSLLSSNNYLRE